MKKRFAVISTYFTNKSKKQLQPILLVSIYKILFINCLTWFLDIEGNENERKRKSVRL